MLRSGIAPKKAAPAAPPPPRPPRRAATVRGSGPSPSCGGASLGAGAEHPARPLRQVALRSGIGFSSFAGEAERRSSRYYRYYWDHRSWSPGTGAKREELEALGSLAASRASWPRNCHSLCLGAAVGAAEVATVRPGRDEEPRSPRGWAFFYQENPDREGAEERPRPSRENN